MIEQALRPLLGGGWPDPAPPVAADAPEPASAPPEAPRWPCQAWTTAEVIAREPTRTLWRITTWQAGAKVAQREEWRTPSEDDEATGLESRGG